MNFQSLKSMVNNLIQTYRCASCSSPVDETNVEIVWTAWSSVNVEIECPECRKHIIVRAQVYAIDLPSDKANPEWLKELQETLENTHPNSNLSVAGMEKILNWQIVNKNAIKDETIVDLNKTLKTRNISVDDIFKNEEK